MIKSIDENRQIFGCPSLISETHSSSTSAVELLCSGDLERKGKWFISEEFKVMGSMVMKRDVRKPGDETD
jgi:hypothetical protein